MKFAGFEWDEGNWPKCGKHGVTKQEIEELFKEAVSVFPAPHRSNIEHRSIAIGKKQKGTDDSRRLHHAPENFANAAQTNQRKICSREGATPL